MNKKDIKKGLLPYLLLLLLVAGVYYVLTMKTIKVNELTYDKLIKEVSEQNVEKITITPKSGESIYVFDGKLKNYGEDEVFHAVAPYSETVINQITFSYEAEVYAVINGLGSCQGHSFQGFAAYKDIAFGFYDTGICRCII